MQPKVHIVYAGDTESCSSSKGGLFNLRNRSQLVHLVAYLAGLADETQLFGISFPPTSSNTAFPIIPWRSDTFSLVNPGLSRHHSSFQRTWIWLRSIPRPRYVHVCPCISRTTNIWSFGHFQVAISPYRICLSSEGISTVSSLPSWSSTPYLNTPHSLYHFLCCSI